MATSRVCVLIADLPVVASALRQTLPLDHVEVLEAHTFDEATQLAERRHPRICIIGCLSTSEAWTGRALQTSWSLARCRCASPQARRKRFARRTWPSALTTI